MSMQRDFITWALGAMTGALAVLAVFSLHLR